MGESPVQDSVLCKCDYSLAKWDTSRNRIYVNSIETKTLDFTRPFFPYDPTMINPIQYKILKQNGYPDYTEANRIDAINRKKYTKHNNAVKASHIFWGIVGLPTVFVPMFCWTFIECDSHYPPKYGDGGRGD